MREVRQKMTFLERYPKADTIAAADLARALDGLEVPFIAGGSDSTTLQMPQPAVLMASLAASDEARLRLALIPLLLRHPEFALHAGSALQLMTPQVQTGFKCYYTAALLLQQKHRDRLETVFSRVHSLPDLFSAELQMSDWPDPDTGLRALADRQKALTGRSINWLGTYEHGAMRLLRTLEGRKRWQA